MKKHQKHEYYLLCDESGFVLVLSMVMIIVVSLMAVAAARNSVAERLLSGNYSRAKLAISAAEAGVHDGISRLLSGAIVDSSQSETAWNATSTYQSSSANFANTFSVKHLVRNGQVINDFAGRPFYVVEATGYDTASRGAKKTVEAIVSLSKAVFPKGMTGCQGIDGFGRAFVDSYDSTNGPYDSNSARANGSLGTCDPGANISLTGSVDIRGTAEATGVVTLDGGANVSGGTTNGIPVTECDPVNVTQLVAGQAPPVGTTPQTLTMVNKNEQTITAVPGVTTKLYYDSITMSGGTLTVNGSGKVVMYIAANGFKMSGTSLFEIGSNVDLTVYTTGPIDFSGQDVVNYGPPTHFMIYSAYASSGDNDFGVTLNGGSDFGGGIYAPKSNVKITGNAVYRGAVRGKKVNDGGTNQFHYDEALSKKAIEGYKGYTLMSWKEVFR